MNLPMTKRPHRVQELVEQTARLLASPNFDRAVAHARWLAPPAGWRWAEPDGPAGDLYREVDDGHMKFIRRCKDAWWVVDTDVLGRKYFHEGIPDEPSAGVLSGPFDDLGAAQVAYILAVSACMPIRFSPMSTRS